MMLHKVKNKKRKVSRIPSTFTTNAGGNPHSARKMLHSKSTYFYRWGSRLNYVVPSVCNLALLVGEIITFSPILDRAYAEGVASIDDNGTMLATDPTITLTITPDSDNTNSNVTAGTVAYFSNTITVGGSGISKYYLTLNTPNGSTGNLVGQNNQAAIVNKVAHNTTPANFIDNTWGYAVSANTSTANSSLSYNPVPSGTGDNNAVYLAAKTGAPASGGDKYKLVFAAKLGSGMPSDHYQSNIYVSAVANVDATVSLGIVNNSGRMITKMQDMTSRFCTNMDTGTTGQLVDERDNNIYWVAKLADGNCWMTQNLDYNGGGIKCGNEGAISGWTNGDTYVAEYYDHGLQVLNGTSWVDVTGWIPYTREELDDMSVTRKIIDADIRKYDSHYLSGNYYSWLAAKNGDSAVPNTQGICPLGWVLPNSQDANKSWRGLMSAYGVTDNSAGSTILRQTPIYAIYTGSIGYSGALGNIGSAGYWWASKPDSTSGKAYFFWTNPSYARYTSNNGQLGYAVRCVNAAI